VQRGCSLDLQVVECAAKGGFGVRTNELIKKGSFVIEYAGEWIGVEESERLLKERTDKREQNFVMFLREFGGEGNWRQTTVIDARNYGNKARFINHGCEPNLFVVPVRVNCMLAHAGLFALRDIEPGEELCYDYCGGLFELADVGGGGGTRCRCGSGQCRGFLPQNSGV
jgi:histone-lysine N-methyltransferase SETMAR